MPKGFLAVSTQPSALLSLDDFHGWYEDEHIPLRLNHLPAFLSGARYRAIDGSEAGPGWLAMYEIDDTRTFGEDSYTSLRLRRSERETSVMQRLEVLTRLTGEDLGVYGLLEGERSTGLKTENPSLCVVTHLLNIGGEDDEIRERLAKEWAQDMNNKIIKSLPGWIRLRLIKVLESGKAKMGIPVESLPNEQASHFVVHGKSSSL